MDYIKKHGMYILVVLLIVLSVGYTAYSEFSGKQIDYFSIHNVQFKYIAMALGCFALALVADGLKYLILLRKCQGGKDFTLSFETALIGRFFDNVTPSGVGGQPFQINYLQKNGSSKGTSVAVPMAGFVSSQLSFCLIGAICVLCPIAGQLSPATRFLVYIGLICYLIVPVCIVSFLISKSWCIKACYKIIEVLGKIRIIKDKESAKEKSHDYIEETVATMKTVFSDAGTTLRTFSAALLYHINILLIPCFILMALGSEIDIVTEIIKYVYVYLSITIMPTPGNSGAAELSFYSLFTVLGSKNVFFAMLLWRFLCYYMFIIIGAVIYARQYLQRKYSNK